MPDCIHFPNLYSYIVHHVTSNWVRWRLKSPASRLFTQRFIQTQIKENTKAPRHWPLCREFTGHWWIPRTNGQQRGKCFHLMTSSGANLHFRDMWHFQAKYANISWRHILSEHNWYNIANCRLRLKFTGRAMGHGSASALQWHHNERDGVSNHQPHDCLFSRLFRRRSKKTSELRVTGLCEGNSPVTGEFPAQMASNAENCSIWWRHHGKWIAHV